MRGRRRRIVVTPCSPHTAPANATVPRVEPGLWPVDGDAAGRVGIVVGGRGVASAGDRDAGDAHLDGGRLLAEVRCLDGAATGGVGRAGSAGSATPTDDDEGEDARDYDDEEHSHGSVLASRWKAVTIGVVFPEVLAAARAGADWAWERLYDSVAGAVRGYLAAHGASDAEELTGEVLLQLVRGLPRFEGDEAGFRSWVFLVAHHRLIDERRRQRRDDVLARQPRTTTAPGADTDSETRLAEAEWGPRLRRLTDDQRDVILLRVVADLSAEEVGRILGKKPGAVRVLQHRALALLRAAMEAAVTP